MKKISLLVGMLLMSMYAMCGALHDAVRRGDLDEVHNLVQAGADVNESVEFDGELVTPIIEAAKLEKFDIVGYLAEQGADLNAGESETTVLGLVCKWGKYDLAKYLVDKGADVSEDIEGGKCLLHLTIEKGSLERVKWLIGNGVEIDNEALSVAAWSGHLNIVKYLIEQGSALNETSPRTYFNTPLTAALGRQNYDIVKCLVEHGANLKERNDIYGAPLHAAIAFGAPLNIVQYLIESGARLDKDICDVGAFLRLTPSECARYSHRGEEMIKYLEQVEEELNH